MGFEEKIAELLRLREQGLLTQEEFESLVKRTREDGTGGQATLPPPASDSISGMSDLRSEAAGTQTSVIAGDVKEGSSNKKRAGVAAVLLAVGVIVAVVVANGGDSEPTNSNEYKELIAQQKVLESELSDLQADVIKLKDKAESEMEKLADEQADWLRRLENNRKALKDLEALK
jgi:hypothetical protein